MQWKSKLGYAFLGRYMVDLTKCQISMTNLTTLVILIEQFFWITPKQKGCLSKKKKNNLKNHMFFMPRTFSQGGQYKHFSQVELFEKPLFLVMMTKMCLRNCKVKTH
jgi:hypothetical protein